MKESYGLKTHAEFGRIPFHFNDNGLNGNSNLEERPKDISKWLEDLCQKEADRRFAYNTYTLGEMLESLRWAVKIQMEMSWLFYTRKTQVKVTEGTDPDTYCVSLKYMIELDHEDNCELVEQKITVVKSDLKGLHPDSNLEEYPENIEQWLRDSCQGVVEEYSGIKELPTESFLSAFTAALNVRMRLSYLFFNIRTAIEVTESGDDVVFNIVYKLVTSDGAKHPNKNLNVTVGIKDVK